VVAIAQLVEHWIVIPGVAGSIPVGHPIFFFPSKFNFKPGFFFERYSLSEHRVPFLSRILRSEDSEYRSKKETRFKVEVREWMKTMGGLRSMLWRKTWGTIGNFSGKTNPRWNHKIPSGIFILYLDSFLE
jgi:hypothetical protein